MGWQFITLGFGFGTSDTRKARVERTSTSYYTYVCTYVCTEHMEDQGSTV